MQSDGLVEIQINETYKRVNSDVIINKTIYKNDRSKTHGGRKFLIALIVAAILIATASVIIISILQRNEYKAYMKGSKQFWNYIVKVYGFCGVVDVRNFDVLSTPLAALLMIIIAALYQRRTFLRKKYSFKYIGLPMVVSCFSKTDRVYTGIVYGRIAFEIFNMMFGGDGPTQTAPLVVGDPTGLFNLLMKIVEMFMIGIRYYPILVAYRVKNPFVYLISAIYMWIDFGSTIYQTGVCEGYPFSFDEEKLTYGIKEKLEATFEHKYWILFKVFTTIPIAIFSSYVAISLTFRTIKSIIHSIKRTENRKDCCSKFLTLNDNKEILYSKSDISYVLDLFRCRKTNDDETHNENSSKTSKFKFLYKFVNKSYKVDETNESKENEKEKEKKGHVSTKSRKEKLQTVFKKHVYDWNPSFKFSSRFISSHIVGLVALYYFMVTIFYVALVLVLPIVDRIPDEFKGRHIPLDFGKILCEMNEDMCPQESSLKKPSESGFKINIPIPGKILKFLPELKRSIISATIAPLIIAFIICLIQLFLSVKDTRHHLIQLYKGECDFVPRRKLLTNPSIASSSFHYGGYLVGYLIWGYVLQLCFMLLISMAILFMRIFIGDQVFLKFMLQSLPVIAVIVIKTIVSVVTSKYIFLNRKAKLLSLDNFRAYNVFLYFLFFFDCFMGIISAIIRLIKSLILNMFMMPRMSYGFLGRQLERKDNGYSTYVGFLYMEAIHTNPVLMTFCSLLLYKGLSEHIKEHVKNNPDTNPPEFIGLIKEKALQRPVAKKQYKKHIVNKWHVMVMLTKNPRLVFYRKQKE